MSGEQLIAVGAAAPDFELAASDGRTYRLSDVLRGHHAALVFYPGNNTPG
jgi:peroxiredoxin